ncbi:MAG: DUF4332 domain-containing protein [Gammaproteobacteria bacterium]|nr:DUF4332 domain-containing protein [Gammaproteobacteria bacterium]
MGYLIFQMLFCLLLAAIIGGIIGWILKSLCCKKREDTLLDEVGSYKARISQAESENQGFKASFLRFESDANDMNTQIVSLTKERDQFKEKSYDIEASASSLSVGDADGPKDTYDIEEIEGIGQGYGKRLRSIEIKTTADLIANSGTSEERELIAQTVKVEAFVIGKWVSMADLIRVSGIRGQFAELLEASGIKSVESLAQQNIDALTKNMEEVNAKEHRTRINPTEEMVSGWIKAAKELA